ncbi:MAG: response regulator [Candidatus Obscuribacterales bacterium]|nr:response regulator [Cyanobacteria bacterium HKST-UBA01]MCB9471441.1 response regulator [Candidatus Obscuribacterales bacterium]
MNIEYIMLIDDSKADNFLHSIVLSRTDSSLRIEAHISAKAALESIYQSIQTGENLPDLIFVDQNMPGLDGFDFIEGFDRITAGEYTETVIVMLSTCEDLLDKDQAERFASLSLYMSKPLTTSKVIEVRDQFFSNQTGSCLPANNQHPQK